MIYLLLFLYLSYLVIKYDVLEEKKNKWLHLYIILILLIFVSGFRYRLGTDTYTYINEFEKYPDLFHLTIEDFSNFRYQPFWVLLNSIGKTLGSFIFVQFIVSIIHISLLGKFLKQICPSLIFSSILLYYIYDYAVFNMEVMRESVAVSLFLMALLSLSRSEKKRAYIYIGVAFMFHVYSLLVFVIFILFKKLMSINRRLSYIVFISIAILSLLDKNFIINFIMNHIVGTDTLYSESVISYAMSKRYGETNLSWKGIFTVFFLPIVYIYLLSHTKKMYIECVNFNRNLFEATIFMAVSYILLKYNLGIIDRMYNYFHVFTFLLIILFVKQKTVTVKMRLQRIPVYMLMMFIPVSFACRMYMRKDSLVENLRMYSRYYPYSSVFDKQKDSDRERIFVYKDYMVFE